MKDYRQAIKDKKRIVVKIGSSSLQHAATGDLDYILHKGVQIERFHCLTL